MVNLNALKGSYNYECTPVSIKFPEFPTIASFFKLQKTKINLATVTYLCYGCVKE